MGWGFRKSIRVAPGVRLNIGKKSASVRVGGRGFGITKSTTGRTTLSAGLPGTGLYDRETLKGMPSVSPQAGHVLSSQAFGQGEPTGAETPGTSPSSVHAPKPPRQGNKPATWQFGLLGGALITMIFSLAGNAAWVLGIAGVALAGWGLFQSKAAKWPLIVAGAALLFAGIGQSSAQARQAQPAQLVPSPAPTVTTTVTATPTPSAGPTPTLTPTATSAPASIAPLAAPATTKAAVSGSGTTSGRTSGGSTSTGGSSVYYANCTEVKAAGAAPIHRGQPGYSSKLDRDGDGVACEN